MEKKYFCEYDSGIKAADLAQQILNDPELPKLKSIIVGAWDEEMCDTSCDAIIKMMVENKEKFEHIESLFLGDMESEENEVSWIYQGDYSTVWGALPNLKSFIIKGSTDLNLGEIEHANLEEFTIITGGLPREAVKSLKTAKLPNLKKLVLYLGVNDYGYDCEVTDFADLARKDLFPSLKYLGFVNSEEQDAVVKVILESDILPQLEVVDISFGCLTDKGGQLILDCAEKFAHLKKLNVIYHYMTDDMAEKFKALPFQVDVSDKQEPYKYKNEEWLNPMITE
jgi:hypothetical protein